MGTRTSSGGGPRPARFRRHYLEALALWIGAAFALYLVFEVIDQLWIADLPTQSRDTARLFRGAATALSATIVTAVFILWRAAPAIRDGASPSFIPGDLASGPRSGLAQWLVGLRWIALLVLVPVVLAVTSGGQVPTTGAKGLWVGVCGLLAFNAALTFVPMHRQSSTLWLTFQVFIDALALAYLIHQVGGVANPFAGFFVFHAVIAGIVLDDRLARRVAAGIAGIVAVQTLFEATGVLSPGCTRALDGMCRAPDPLHTVAAGVGLLILVSGSSAFVVALVARLRREASDLSRARAVAFEERERLSSVLECIADAVLFADREGNIVLRNRAASTLWPGGTPGPEDLRVCHSAETWAQLLGVLQDPSISERHPLLTIGDRCFEATYGRVCDSADQLQGVVMVARDVTERRMEQNWRMREERMSTVGKLAAALAHELNNPLSSIALYSQHALGKVAESDPLHEHLETIRRNADQCKSTLEDLLENARLRPPERRKVATSTLIGDAVRTLLPVAERAGVDLLQDVSGAPASVHCDPKQIGQVLVNLGLNAIEAIDGGGVVRFTAHERDTDHVVIEVADSGPGIPLGDRNRVFSAFHTTKTEGTGLGLTVVSDVVAGHGSRVELETAPEGGALFRFVLRRSAMTEAGEAAE